MRKIFSYILWGVFLITVIGHSQIKISYPDYIPFNSSFDVSLLTRNTISKAEKLEIVVLTDNKIDFNKAEIRAAGFVYKIKFYRG